MKMTLKTLSAAMLSAVVLLASCQKDEPAAGNQGNNNNNDSAGEQIGQTVTMDITVDGQWSEADVLGLSIPSTGQNNLAVSYKDGKFSKDVTTPQKEDVVYSYYPFTPTASEGKFTVTLPSAIAGNSGKVQAKVGSAISLGEITDPISLTIPMRDLLGTVQLNLSDLTAGSLEGTQIQSVAITSESDIAGNVAIEIANGNTVLSEGTKVIVITPSEGTAFGSAPVVLSFSALPGTYIGQICVTTSATEYEFPMNATVTAGQTVEVNLECGPAEYKGIASAEDWNAFMAAVIAGSYDKFVNPETGAVELAASFTSEETLDYPGTEENASIEFNGTFDGMGYEITCNKFTRPLFNFLGKDAVIKNLIVKGTYTELMNSGICGNAVIAKVNKGTVENVTSYVTTDITIANGVIFGAICGQNGGTLKNCKNYGDMTITYSASGNSGFYGGGIAAIGHTVSGDPVATALNVDDTCTPGQFINCENHGDIVITATNGKPVRQGYGGICGLVYMNGVKFEGCANTGNISRISNGELSNNFSASVGGILGRSAAWYRDGNGDSGALDTSVMGFDTEFYNCSNSGTIYSKCRHSGGITATGTCARADGIGGIAGTLIGSAENKQKITNCFSTGDVTGGWNANVNTAALGGLAGIASHTEISGCNVICKIESKSDEFIGAAGGVVACVMDAVSVDNCTVKPAMAIYAYTGKPFLYGLIFGNIKGAATVGTASVGGWITADGVTPEITADNYTSYLVSAKSNAQLASTEGVSWSK